MWSPLEIEELIQCGEDDNCIIKKVLQHMYRRNLLHETKYGIVIEDEEGTKHLLPEDKHVDNLSIPIKHREIIKQLSRLVHQLYEEKRSLQEQIDKLYSKFRYIINNTVGLFYTEYYIWKQIYRTGPCDTWFGCKLSKDIVELLKKLCNMLNCTYSELLSFMTWYIFHELGKRTEQIKKLLKNYELPLD